MGSTKRISYIFRNSQRQLWRSVNRKERKKKWEKLARFSPLLLAITISNFPFWRSNSSPRLHACKQVLWGCSKLLISSETKSGSLSITLWEPHVRTDGPTSTYVLTRMYVRSCVRACVRVSSNVTAPVLCIDPWKLDSDWRKRLASSARWLARTRFKFKAGPWSGLAAVTVADRDANSHFWGKRAFLH